MNDLERKVFDMYKKEINDEHCKKCKDYDRELSSPLKRNLPQSFFHIGNNFGIKGTKKRLVFVGKNSWNAEKNIRKDPMIGHIKDLSKFGEGAFNHPEKYPRSAYWRYIRDITKKLNLTLDDIGITNLVKCNIYNAEENQSVNITNSKYFEECIDIFEKEIQIMKPTHIIFFTGADYDYLIRKLRFGFKDDFKENGKFNKDYKMEISNKEVSIKTI